MTSKSFIGIGCFLTLLASAAQAQDQDDKSNVSRLMGASRLIGALGLSTQQQQSPGPYRRYSTVEQDDPYQSDPYRPGGRNPLAYPGGGNDDDDTE
jgi:hypothetical protein